MYKKICIGHKIQNIVDKKNVEKCCRPVFFNIFHKSMVIDDFAVNTSMADQQK